LAKLPSRRPSGAVFISVVEPVGLGDGSEDVALAKELQPFLTLVAQKYID